MEGSISSSNHTPAMEVDDVGEAGDTTEDEETSSEKEENDTSAATTMPAFAATTNGSHQESDPPPPTAKPKPIRIKLKMPKKSASGLPAPARKASPASTETKEKRPPSSLPLAHKAISRKLPMSSSPSSQPSSHNKQNKRKRSVSPRPGLPMAATSAASSRANSPFAEKGDNKLANNSGHKPKSSKSRIRSLKLPMTNKPLPSADAEMGVLQATVVNSDEDMQDEAVATVVSSGAATTSTTQPSHGSSKVTSSSTAATKRKNPIKIRIPPLLSPGLRVAGAVPSSNNNKSAPTADASFVGGAPTTAAEVFDQAMAAAGYTVEARTERPHRGSSTTRGVGDMFDSNVKLAVHFPPLVSLDLWELREGTSETASMEEKEGDDVKMEDAANSAEPKDPSISTSAEETKNPPDAVNNGDLSKSKAPTGPLVRGSLVEELVTARSSVRDTQENATRRNGKRPRPWNYREFLPVVFSIPFPESYINDQLVYVKQVHEREKAIIRKQEVEAREQFLQDSEQSAASQVVVPPIPPMPTPPVIKDAPGFLDKYQDQHPLYPPKANPSFVAHLDSKCFHISEGRYFGLSSNKLADPNFVGANAPGISGLSAAGGAGLATSLSGGATATSITLSSTFQGTNAGAPSSSDLLAPSSVPEAPLPTEPPAVAKKSTPDSKPLAKKPQNAAASSSTSTVTSSNAEGPPKKKKKPAPTPTASTSSLRKVMGEGGEMADKTRQRIIRAAVYASRSGAHNGPFQLGEKIYPDVGKAFAHHAGVKPCLRCKNNKQGAYHCRLRRKHDECDFDGGASAAEIQHLFHVPLDKLMEEEDEED